VVQAVAIKWRDLGVELLNTGSVQNDLAIIEANHRHVSNVGYNKVILAFLAQGVTSIA